MGNWTLEANNQRLDLTLEQTFQKINGSVGFAPLHAGLRDTRLRGRSSSSPTSARTACGATSPAG
jgi:hypothetical protein